MWEHPCVLLVAEPVPVNAHNASFSWESEDIYPQYHHLAGYGQKAGNNI